MDEMDQEGNQIIEVDEEEDDDDDEYNPTEFRIHGKKYYFCMTSLN